MKKNLIISFIIVIFLAVGFVSAARTDFSSVTFTTIYGGVGNGWATSSDNLVLRPASTAHTVVIGGTATTSTGYLLEVAGAGLFQGALKSYGIITGTNFVGTSTTATSSVLSDFAVGTSTNLIANFTIVDNTTSSSTIVIGSPFSGSNAGILCMWNGENYTTLYFGANDTVPNIATSSTCN